MAQRKAAESVLITAAKALDRALEDFAVNADNIRRAPLTTQKQLERARELLAAMAPAEALVQRAIAALEAAIREADVVRVEQTAAVAQRQPHIDARAAELQRLLDVYIGLGVRATEGASDPAALGVVATESDALLVAAKKGDFPDIVRLAEALAKQVAGSRAKLKT